MAVGTVAENYFLTTNALEWINGGSSLCLLLLLLGFATISTHFKDGTCNIKLGNHRKENIQKRRKIEVKIGAFGSNHLESSKKLLSI
jgi:hypothetical protein